jgi:hypothetical protein
MAATPSTNGSTAGQETFEGLGPPAKITIVGVAEAFGEGSLPELDLGVTVRLQVQGHVVLEGRESLEEKGARRVFKIRADLIEFE